jgi:hypothetical protein
MILREMKPAICIHEVRPSSYLCIGSMSNASARGMRAFALWLWRLLDRKITSEDTEGSFRHNEVVHKGFR